ncbi:hypothetical protein PAQ31011_00775 [Pandoraea aquatica]|uniref:Uncharacterized protein n=1 Tax=Pandoraea aquatica TaxID=2508290 RepID=A0A5E4SIU6_9BURK|nr:hypothetical protein [Pandoraea aquatica]VVD74158.1 hypothetical protein PAQ31011_00775 [Pandoraea aquatica]
MSARITHLYQYKLPGDKRWKKTRHHMDEDFAREWFAKLKPGFIYERIESTAVDIGEPKPFGPISHGGWQDKPKR